jgi:flagellar assembly factor FliW
MINTLKGTRFGVIEYLTEDVVKFDQGLIGFESLNGFLILSHGEGSPFRWLQSIDEPALAFLTADPNQFLPEFAIDLSDALASELELTSETATLILATVSIPPGKPDDLTLNLAGPIILNLDSRSGKQIVVDGNPDELKYRVFNQTAAA